MTSDWLEFRNSVSGITALALPRWIEYSPTSTQLHAFTDASRRAIAATVYSRTINEDETISTYLLAAKTKLAPIKGLASKSGSRATIPRLELRAALLGAQLLRAQSETLKISLKDCSAWSDSQVVLAWLSSDEPVDNDFVDNYIAHIQELLPGVNWRHVDTKQNPADLATGGCRIENLKTNHFWWQGPPWLAQPENSWPNHTSRNEREKLILGNQNLPEARCMTTQVTPTIVERFSTLSRLLKTLVRCRRLLRWRSTINDTVSPLAPIT